MARKRKFASDAERIAAFNEKRKERGYIRVTAMISPDAVKALLVIRDQSGHSQSQVISDALIMAARISRRVKVVW